MSLHRGRDYCNEGKLSWFRLVVNLGPQVELEWRELFMHRKRATSRKTRQALTSLCSSRTHYVASYSSLARSQESCNSDSRVTQIFTLTSSLDTGRPGFDSQQAWAWSSLFATSFRAAHWLWRPTQVPAQCVPGVIYPSGVKR